MQPFSWGRAQSIEVPPDDDTYAKAALGDGYFGGVESRCFCHDIFVTKCLKPSFCWDASCFLALVFFSQGAVLLIHEIGFMYEVCWLLASLILFQKQ